MWFLACLFATFSTLVAGQQRSDQAVVSIDGVSSDLPRRVSAIRVEIPPVLDGAVLDDPAWADAMVATWFVQNRPDEGDAASDS